MLPARTQQQAVGSVGLDPGVELEVGAGRKLAGARDRDRLGERGEQAALEQAAIELAADEGRPAGDVEEEAEVLDGAEGPGRQAQVDGLARAFEAAAQHQADGGVGPDADEAERGEAGGELLPGDRGEGDVLVAAHAVGSGVWHTGQGDVRGQYQPQRAQSRAGTGSGSGSGGDGAASGSSSWAWLAGRRTRGR